MLVVIAEARLGLGQKMLNPRNGENSPSIDDARSMVLKMHKEKKNGDNDLQAIFLMSLSLSLFLSLSLSLS